MQGCPRGLLLTFACLLLAPAAAFADLGYVRDDPDDPFYLVGYLSWNAGKGRISWDPVDSQDPGGTLARLPEDEFLPTDNVFVSDPLPNALFVNGSRLIQLDLYTPNRPTSATHGSSCYIGEDGLGVRIDHDGVPFAGIDPGFARFDMGDYYRPPSAQFPPDPPGHGVCRLRMQAEEDHLRAGDVLRMVITEYHYGKLEFGMAGDHHSVLRIPYFTDFELPYRYPAYAHGSPLEGDDLLGYAPGDLGSVVGLLGVLAVIPGTARRRTLLACIIVLSSTAFAGCIGGTPSQSRVGPSGPREDPSAVSYQTGNLSSAGTGSIIGEVKAVGRGEPVVGAHVVILGRPDSTPSDGFGRFMFRDLPPDTYTIRIDHADFVSHESRVKVIADLIARVNVTLLRPGSDRAPIGQHTHDYWPPDAREVTLLEDFPVVPGASTALACTVACVGETACANGCEFRIPPPEDDGFQSILPGTYEVNVTIRWDIARLGHRNVSLGVQANNEPSFSNWSRHFMRGPGEAFRIATTWEMGDSGHQHFSTWLFQIVSHDANRENRNNPQSYLDRGAKVLGALQGDAYHVTLTIRKGVVPLEAAHKDFWRGASALDVVRDMTQNLRWSPYGGDYNHEFRAWDNIWLPAKLVPPGTEWVEVFANFSRASSPSYPDELRIHTARDGAPTVQCWGAGQSGGSCHGPDYRPYAGTAEQHQRWAIPVEGDETDPFYASRSFWVFGLSTKPDLATTALATLDRYGHVEGSSPAVVTVTLTIVAHQGSAPAS